MKVRFAPLRCSLYPLSLLFYSLSHYHHWSWPRSIHPCPADKPLTLRWTVGSSTTVTEKPPQLWGHLVHITPVFQLKLLKVDLDCNHECPGIVMENVTNEQNDLRYHLSDIRPLPCLQPTLAIIYREPHRHKTLIQVVITVHGTVCTVNHMLWPARVP